LALRAKRGVLALRMMPRSAAQAALRRPLARGARGARGVASAAAAAAPPRSPWRRAAPLLLAAPLVGGSLFVQQQHAARADAGVPDSAQPGEHEGEGAVAWGAFELAAYKLVPLRLLSMVWGWVTAVDMPWLLRKQVFLGWAAAFDCKLDEMRDPLEIHQNLAEFFMRRIKVGARPMADVELVSPADGEVVQVCEVDGDVVVQVKGITYSLSALLGRAPPTSRSKRLMCATVYLSPGDYHRFHSPADFELASSRHYSGYLFSVSSFIMRAVPGLLAINERVVLDGTWAGGYFGMVAVAATNVGNIRLVADPELRTNRFPSEQAEPLAFEPACAVGKGDEVGTFRLGSTIVIVAEAGDMEWAVKPGQKVQVGEALIRAK